MEALKKKSFRRIYTMSMAKYLLEKGFKQVAVLPDPRNIRRDVWLFLETPEFAQACDEYIAMPKPYFAGKTKTEELPVDDQTLSDLYYIGNQDVTHIAAVYHVSVDRVLNAIRKDGRKEKLFAYALMTSAERAEADAATPEKRDELFRRKLDETKYIVHSAHSTTEGVRNEP